MLAKLKRKAPLIYFLLSDTATDMATVTPTMGLFPIPTNPIISTWAGTEEEPANVASAYIREIISVKVNNNLPNGLTNTGAWFAGYPFSPSLGCGTWGGNICSKNVTLEYYMNTTWIATEIDRKAPTEEELFGDTGVMHD